MDAGDRHFSAKPISNREREHTIATSMRQEHGQTTTALDVDLCIGSLPRCGR